MIRQADRLFDISTRLQVYTEGVKTYQTREFDQYLFKVKREFDTLLRRVRYKSLDQLTKNELYSLIRALRKSQSKLYSQYVNQVINQLRDFMNVDLNIKRRVYTPDDDAKELPSDNKAISALAAIAAFSKAKAVYGLAAVLSKEGSLWANVANKPMGANGLTVGDFFKTFSISAQANLENILKKAYANGWTVEETLEFATSLQSKQGASSAIQKIKQQANAVIRTAVQHVSSTVSEAMLSSMYEKYIWVSVIDSRTSDICRSRNMNIYDYGRGPVPPAHVNCRSHIMPLMGSGKFDFDTFYSWVQTQSTDVQNDIFGDRMHKASDLEGWNYKEPLSLEEFANRANRIFFG